MALIVCCIEAGSKVDWSKKAIYLDQNFYELLFNCCCWSANRYPSLKAMVSLGYGDELILGGDRVTESLQALEQIAKERAIDHPQISLLCSVLRQVAVGMCEIAVAGDMHPDLSRSAPK